MVSLPTLKGLIYYNFNFFLVFYPPVLGQQIYWRIVEKDQVGPTHQKSTVIITKLKVKNIKLDPPRIDNNNNNN